MLKDEYGSVLVEMGLLGPVFCALVAMMFITGIWIYNVSQAKQAARLAAHHLAVTGNYYEARQVAQKYISKTKLAATTKNISVYWDGEMARGNVVIEMETFFPGLPKLLNPSAPGWTGGVTISEEAVTTGEYRFRQENRELFNYR